MAETGNPLTPPLVRGAIVQLIEEFGVPIPNIVGFQYNPGSVTIGVKPFDPGEVDPTKRGAQAPQAQPYDPEETYKFDLELDATDDLEDGDITAAAVGVADRIAAIRKLTEPTKGLITDLVASAQSLSGNPITSAERPSVAVALLVLGPGVVLPVRVTSITVEIKEFTPLLYPHMATVQLELKVLTPEMFKCKSGVTTDLAIAAYDYTRLQQNALAILNAASNVASTRSLLPF